MQAEGTRPTLESVLREEVRCTEGLLSCLETERSALTARDMNALQVSTGEKLDHTRRLEQLELQREALITQLGFDTDPDSLQRCFRSQPGAAKLTQLWQQVLNNIEACQTCNLTNGGILESSRQHIEQALCILRGQTDNATLYNPAGGNTATDLGQRELGKV
jgi:flagella synthesis protein FlgN